MPQQPHNAAQPLTVSWISDFPLEWLGDLPESVRSLPRQHPATWEITLLSEFEKNPTLKIHVILLRKQIQKSLSFERRGVVFHVLKTYPLMRIGSLFWWDTLLIRRLCRRIRPDLVHAWGNETGAMLVASRLGRPYVATVQGLLGWYKNVVPLVRYERFLEWVERRSLPRAPVVTTESSFAVQYLKEHYPQLRVHQAEHAPNWAFHQVARQPILQPIHFISIGTLGHRKGTDLLFRALDRLVPELDFRLTVVSGPNAAYLESLRSTVSETLWKRVNFKHHLLPNEVAGELQTPLMMLLPTRADVSPNAVKESLVAGLPVVASQIGGIPDYLIHGKNGYLFPTGDFDAFLGRIREALAHPLFGKGKVDPETYNQIRGYLSPERMAKNFLAAYELAKVKSQLSPKRA